MVELKLNGQKLAALYTLICCEIDDRKHFPRCVNDGKRQYGYNNDELLAGMVLIRRDIWDQSDEAVKLDLPLFSEYSPE